MKLEIGTYVRFENVICQIEEVEEDWLCFDIGFYNHWNELTYSMKYKEFVEEYKPKFSNNLIDLIEVGDIVVLINGMRKEELMLIKDLDKEIHILNTHKIVSILTKEQFESMSYRVGSGE